MAESNQLDISLRPPGLSDGARIWQLVEESGVLDRNSSYLYLLLCRDFANTSIVATLDDTLVGFVSGYRPPDRPEALFVWQVAVAEAARKQGLARRMIGELLARCQREGVLFLEATVAESNIPSRRLFESIAREFSAPLETTDGFQESDFPTSAHEAEPIIRIGPLEKRPVLA